MRIPILTSIKNIEYQYDTGELPVLVVCSDKKSYICKYMRSSAAAFKLVCELIGAQMANVWQLNTPPVAFVNIKPVHWRLPVTHCLSVPSWGCCKLEGVIDITPSTYKQIESSKNLLAELLKIALFDFWIANEDRNMNNANLLYDVLQQKFVPIDYELYFEYIHF